MGVVFVTGAGVVAPSGHGRKLSYARMLTGISAARRIERFDPAAFKCQVAAVVDGLSNRLGVDDRHVELAMQASEEALREADLAGADFGVVFATAVGASAALETSYRTRARPRNGAFRFDSATEAVAAAVGADGPYFTQTTGCTAGLDALGLAFDFISAGLGDRMLVVAADAPVTPIVLASFDRIGAVSRNVSKPDRASRPFHVNRDGFVLGEGAAAIVLESAQSVERRGAIPICRILGWCSVSSSYHMTAIRSDGSDIARAINGALYASGVGIGDVDALDLHATSTKQNDLAESNAVCSTFGRRATELPVMAQKGVNGHALGASSLIEFVNAITAIQGRQLIPAANLDEQDPLCEVFVPTSPLQGEFATLVKVASGFSGIHTAMVMERVRP